MTSAVRGLTSELPVQRVGELGVQAHHAARRCSIRLQPGVAPGVAREQHQDRESHSLMEQACVYDDDRMFMMAVLCL